MDLSNRNIGYGITGSFCTFAKTRKEIQRLTEMGAHVIPIFSYQTQNCDTRFGTAKEFMEEVCDITGNPGIRTLQEAEPIGPKAYLDVLVIVYRKFCGEAGECNHRYSGSDGCQSAYAQWQTTGNCHIHQRCTGSQF
mgnify:CR=1 FL=1